MQHHHIVFDSVPNHVGGGNVNEQQSEPSSERVVQAHAGFVSLLEPDGWLQVPVKIAVLIACTNTSLNMPANSSTEHGCKCLCK